MPSLESLEQVWRQQLATLAEEASAGDPIWRRPGFIEGGLPVHARSGQPFPGIDALVLWRFGPGPGAHAWEIVEADEGPVVGVSDKGGRRLGRARIVPRSGPPPKTRERAADALAEASARLTAMSPDDLGPSGEAALEMARALVASRLALRAWEAPPPFSFSGRISADALAGVAGVAQVLAWTVAPLPGPEARQDLDGLAASCAVRELLPAELRARGAAPVWDRALATDLLNHPTGSLAPRFGPVLKEPIRRPHHDSISNYLIFIYPEIVRQVLASQALLARQGRASTGSPTQDWRTLGRLFRARVAAGPHDPEPALDLVAEDSELATLLGRVWRAHRRRSWLHHSGSDRAHPSHADPGRRDPRARRLYQLGKPARRASHPAPGEGQEEALFHRLWSALNPGETRAEGASWPELTERLGALPYTRRALRKRSGGLRWLDVPPPPLAEAQRRLHEHLSAAAPASGVATAFVRHRGVPWHARAHAGCRAAVVMDLTDFFGSVRPGHLRPWLAPDDDDPWRPGDLLEGCSPEAREAILRLLFVWPRERGPHLAQGSPSSPIASHLAACRMDGLIVTRAREAFGPEGFTYTRYADDLVLSLRGEGTEEADFLERAETLLDGAARAQGWRVNPRKTRRWQAGHGPPLTLCGLVLPDRPDGRLRLLPEDARRARAAVHRLRTRACYREGGPDLRQSVGMAAWAYAATGDARLLAWTSPRVARLAEALAGPVFHEAFLAGWADEVDAEGGGTVD